MIAWVIKDYQIPFSHQLNYKINQEYSLPEDCCWYIRTNSTITIDCELLDHVHMRKVNQIDRYSVSRQFRWKRPTINYEKIGVFSIHNIKWSIAIVLIIRFSAPPF